MSPPPLDPNRPDAAPRLSVDAALVRGALAHDGQLAVHRAQLTFQPMGDLDRRMGARALRVDIEAITSVTASADGRFLALQAQGERHRFTGRGLDRVASMLAPGQATASLAPSSEVLLTGIVDVRLTTGTWRTARLTLRSDRLDITPIERVRGGAGAEAITLRPWELPNTDLELDRGRLHLHGPERTVTLRGAPVPALADRIAQIADHQSVQPIIDPTFATLRAALRRGPVLHWGELRLSARGLRFQPTGLLDTLVGVRAFTFSWADIRRIELEPDAPRQVALHTAGAITRLELPDGHLTSLTRLLHHAQVEAALQPEAANTWCREVLHAWRQRVPDDWQAPLLASPALHITPDQMVHSGALVLTARGAAFLPEDPTADADLCTWPIDHIARTHAIDLAFPSSIRFEANGGPVQIVPALGAGLVRAFWARCRAPTRTVAWADLTARTRGRVTGPATFVRVTVGDRCLESIPGQTLAHPRGWAAVVPGAKADAPRAGARATIEIGQPEGIYQFDARVAEAAPLPAHVRARGGPERTALLLEDRGEIRVFNQREGLRAPADLPIHLAFEPTDAEPIPEPGGHSGTLRDLSIGGCQLVTRAHAVVGAELAATLKVLGVSLRVRAQVVRAHPPNEDGACVVALRFVRIPQKDEDRIHRFVLQSQRAGLRDVPAAPAPGAVPADIAP